MSSDYLLQERQDGNYIVSGIMTGRVVPAFGNVPGGWAP